jgi:Transglycosylase SLT domain
VSIELGVKIGVLFSALLCVGATAARADYVVLRNGARLNVTGYEILGDHYRLHLKGGVADVPFDDIVGIEPEEVFEPIPPEVLQEKTPFEKAIRTAAERYGLDADLIHCVIAVESNFDPKAISPKNARGLMQLLPQTAAQFGVKDIFDPEENINAGSHYLHDLLAKYRNDLTLALAAYNAGPERVDQYGHRVPPFLETMKYVQRIAKSYAKLKASGTGPKATQSKSVQELLVNH